MRLITTADGSHTIELTPSGDTYRSRHGALSESRHVFIKEGLARINPSHPINLLEVGFGTGLNALLTLLETTLNNCQINYTAIDIKQVPPAIYKQLNYIEQLDMPDFQPCFQLLHSVAYDQTTEVSPCFHFKKLLVPIANFRTLDKFDLVYYDPFSPNSQPELWSLSIFQKIFQLMNPGGLLVTYSSKSSVRRTMKEAGFTVDKVPGPYGKREIVRAMKPDN